MGGGWTRDKDYADGDIYIVQMVYRYIWYSGTSLDFDGIPDNPHFRERSSLVNKFSVYCFSESNGVTPVSGRGEETAGQSGRGHTRPIGDGGCGLHDVYASSKCNHSILNK